MRWCDVTLSALCHPPALWFSVHDGMVLSTEMRKVRENPNHFSLRQFQHIRATLQNIIVDGGILLHEILQ